MSAGLRPVSWRHDHSRSQSCLYYTLARYLNAHFIVNTELVLSLITAAADQDDELVT